MIHPRFLRSQPYAATAKTSVKTQYSTTQAGIASVLQIPLIKQVDVVTLKNPSLTAPYPRIYPPLARKSVVLRLRSPDSLRVKLIGTSPSKKTRLNTLSKQTPTAILQCFQLAQITHARELLHLLVVAIVGAKAYDNHPLLQLVPRTIPSVGRF